MEAYYSLRMYELSRDIYIRQALFTGNRQNEETESSTDSDEGIESDTSEESVIIWLDNKEVMEAAMRRKINRRKKNNLKRIRPTRVNEEKIKKSKQ
jgi:predicted protein tyrosine phosphatase